MRVILHETMTGHYVTELEFTQASAANGICTPDTVTVTLPGYTGELLYPYMVPRKYTLTVVDDYGVIAGCGVMSLPRGDTDDDGINYVTMPGRGVESLFERRPILPYPYWPLVNEEGFPIPERNTVITGVEYGTLMKRLYQQSLTHPGNELPVTFESDRTGTRQNSYPAVDGIHVQTAVDNITQYINGVEYDWVPTLDDREDLTWHLRTATDSELELTTNPDFTWNEGGEDPDIRRLGVQISPEFMYDTAIFSGGKEDDRVVLGRAVDPDLGSSDIPSATLWDSSRSSVSDPAVLDEWAFKAILEGEAPVQYWSFEVRNDRSIGVRAGDWSWIIVEDHWLVPNGTYRRRIVEVERSSDQDYTRLVVAGEMTW